jgi:hypothetical protein
MEDIIRNQNLLIAYTCIEDDCTGNTYFFLRDSIKKLLQTRECIVSEYWVPVIKKLEKYNINLEIIQTNEYYCKEPSAKKCIVRCL